MKQQATCERTRRLSRKRMKFLDSGDGIIRQRLRTTFSMRWRHRKRLRSGPNLEKMQAPLLAINSADDL